MQRQKDKIKLNQQLVKGSSRARGAQWGEEKKKKKKRGQGCWNNIFQKKITILLPLE